MKGNLKMQKDRKGQMKLDGLFPKVPKAREFSKNDVLKAVAEFVVCDDQVRCLDRNIDKC